MKIQLALFVIFVSFQCHSQEYLHWKHHVTPKYDRVKKLIVWTHVIVDNSATDAKSEFCYEARDSIGRTTAIRMYGVDTTFFEYDHTTNWIKIHSSSAEIKPQLRTLYYSKSGKILYEKISNYRTTEYKYVYDRNDQLKKKVNITDNIITKYIIKEDKGVITTTTLVNGQKDLITILYSNDTLGTETIIYQYYKEGNLVRSPDTTVNFYDHMHRQIRVEQFSHHLIERSTEVTLYGYYENGLQSFVDFNGLVVKYYYDSKGYLIKAERFNSDGTLGFSATYEYEFW